MSFNSSASNLSRPEPDTAATCGLPTYKLLHARDTSGYRSIGVVGGPSSSVAVTFPNPMSSGNQLSWPLSTTNATDGVPLRSPAARNNWKTAVDYANGAHVIVFYAEKYRIDLPGRGPNAGALG
jgi:hypothetical protein